MIHMKMLLTMVIIGTVSVANGQKTASEQITQINRLDWLLGEWAGAGWIEFRPGERQTFSQIELVHKKAGGTVLLIEGIGKSKTASNLTVLEAITLVSYEPARQRFRWYSHTDRGYLTDIEPKVGNQTLQWSVDAPEVGTMRYTIGLNEKGQWSEIGEMSKDGNTWRQFFQMTLSRQAGAKP
jgi:hypothetical protein